MLRDGGSGRNIQRALRSTESSLFFGTIFGLLPAVTCGSPSNRDGSRSWVIAIN